MFIDSLGRRRLFVTCKRCGNMGPPERVWSKKLGRFKLACMWCLDKRRKQLRQRLDSGQ